MFLNVREWDPFLGTSSFPRIKLPSQERAPFPGTSTFLERSSSPRNKLLFQERALFLGRSSFPGTSSFSGTSCFPRSKLLSQEQVTDPDVRVFTKWSFDRHEIGFISRLAQHTFYHYISGVSSAFTVAGRRPAKSFIDYSIEHSLFFIHTNCAPRNSASWTLVLLMLC